VIRCRGKDSGLVKENKVFRIVGAFGNNWLGDAVVECISYMLLETRFKISTSLANEWFVTREGNLVKSIAKHRVGFILSSSK
jgi:hypothetical protein